MGSIFISSSYHIQQVAATLLSDEKWLDEVYFPQNLARLQEAKFLVNGRMKALGLEVKEAKAGLFSWVNFRSVVKMENYEDEMKFFNTLFNKYKLYLVPGHKFLCEEPGWFRIIFALKPEHLEEGLRRLGRALE